MGELSGKVAVVTGASKGIGAGIARALGEAGAAVVVNYASSREGADRVVADIVARDGRAIAVQGDVSRAEDAARLFEEAHRAFGPVDVLVNNAGIYGATPIESLSEEFTRRQLEVNVVGLLLATREALRHFSPAGGSIVQIGSVASTSTPPGMVAYNATKGAVDAITATLAKELAPRRIRVNAINPGVVDTEGTVRVGISGSDMYHEAVRRTPLGRAGTPADIGAVAVFLASPASGWITGEQIRVSGGLQ